jgi:type I restriction enzyme S subunit
VDNRGRTCPVGNEGTPLIATNCLRTETLYPTYNTERFVSPEVYGSWFRGHPAPGDIIFVTKGSPGRVCLAPDPVDFCIAQDMVAIRADESVVDQRYLFAVLRSTLARNAIEDLHVGTMIPHFKKGDFDKLMLPIPCRSSQKVIGDLYFDLCQRIELLRETNITLEAIAQALFKSWFVGFDPVHAKAEGREPEGMESATAALFPSEFEESDLGLIPKGWETGPFGSEFNFTMGQSPPGSTYNSAQVGLPFFQGCTDFGDVYPSERIYCSAPTRYAQAGDVLMSVRAPVGALNIATYKCGIGRGLCSVRHKSGSTGLTYLFLKACVERIEGVAGEGALFRSLSKQQLATLPVLAPSNGVIESLACTIEPLIDRMQVAAEQVDSLSALRDTLLPRLISGKLRLPDTIALAERAVA